MDQTVIAHIILAVFNGANLLLTGWLAHRRRMADRDRRWFYSQMRDVHQVAQEDERDERLGVTWTDKP